MSRAVPGKHCPATSVTPAVARTVSNVALRETHRVGTVTCEKCQQPAPVLQLVIPGSKAPRGGWKYDAHVVKAA